jgi:hypothetical protein
LDYASCSVFWGMILGYPTTTAEQCQAFAEAIGREYRVDPDDWDPAGWIFYGIAYPSRTEIDPDIRATYADEWLISYERALWDRSSVEISYVNKKTRDILEDTCRGNFYDGPSYDADCDPCSPPTPTRTPAALPTLGTTSSRTGTSTPRTG